MTTRSLYGWCFMAFSPGRWESRTALEGLVLATQPWFATGSPRTLHEPNTPRLVGQGSLSGGNLSPQLSPADRSNPSADSSSASRCRSRSLPSPESDTGRLTH